MTKDEKYMKEAIKQAKKAALVGDVPIGCVIVHPTFQNNFVIFFKANLPEKFTAELAPGVYKSKTSTNADFDKTVKKQYIKTVTLLPDFGLGDEKWNFIDEVFYMEDEAL